MRLLLDTHVVLATLRRALLTKYPKLAARLAEPDIRGFVSVASLWEIAIKTRLGKLDPGMPLADLDGYLRAVGLVIVPIRSEQVAAAVEPEPGTRDPFDRLLLGVCEAEDLRLITIDRALVNHRLALQI